MADFYICNESHVVIYNSPMNRESVRVGVQWGYINRQGMIPEFSYCCCGVADSDNMTVHGPSVTCRPSVRREVEGAVLQFLNQSRLAVKTLVREYHNFTLTDLEKQFILSFYGFPGYPDTLKFHLSGAYDCFGSPELEVADRDSLLAYSKKICTLAGERINGQIDNGFVELLNLY